MADKIPYEQVMGRMRMDIDYIAEEAYQKGFEVGQHEATTLEYQQGLDDAWECARRIALVKIDKDCPYFTVTELKKIFGCSTVQSVFDTYSASEAIEKLKAHEEQQEQNRRIMFGDKLLTKKDHLGGVALSNEVNGSVYVWREDCVAYESSPQEWRKTGENIPQVAELLKAMKDGEVTE